jgi:PAS domain S-box-containing protein
MNEIVTTFPIHDDAASLAALRALRVLDTPPDPDLDVITLLAADRFDCPIALIGLGDADRFWFKSRHGFVPTEATRTDNFCSHAMIMRDVLAVLDAREDPRFAAIPAVCGPSGIRFYAGAPLITAAGHCIGTLCVMDTRPHAQFTVRDHTALKLMAGQAAACIETARMRQDQPISELIAQTTTDAFVCVDADNRIIHWNRGAEQMFGWRAAEAIGETLDLLVPNRHHHGHNSGMARLRGGGRTKLVGKTVEVPARCKTGHEILVELSLGMWPAEGEGLPKGFASIMRDVSERKRQEAERDAAEAVMARRVAAIEASNDGIAFTDAQGIFVFMNRAHATMFGYPDPSHLIGKPWSVLYGDATAQEIGTAAMPQVFRDGRWRGEVPGRCADGTIIDQEVSLSLSADGGLVCVTRDIGHRLATEREKARLREQLMLAQRQEAVGQLASGIAHDFNNLIAAIAGTASLLEAFPDEEVRRNVVRIQKAASTATALVDKLLALGRRRSERKLVDVRQILISVRDLVTPSLADKRQSVEVDCPETPLQVMADETELLQVVLNFVLNARDALPRNAPGRIDIAAAMAGDAPPTGEIVVGRIRPGPAVIIRVSDTGCGIPRDELGQVFQPFFTRKGDAGTGLGLAVVAGIVGNNGGAVALSSQPGRGTTFELYWPLRAEPGALPIQTPLPADSDDALAGKAVLVVDDNAVVVETLASMLERAGAEPGPCLDPATVIEAVEEDPAAWDLVITDYDMPQMNGAELARRLREIRPDLPILLVTALPHLLERRNGEAALFDGLLAKPASLTDLVKAARTALSVRRRPT